MDDQLRWATVEQRLDTLRWQAQDKSWSYEHLGHEMARVFRDQGELVKEK